MMMSPDASDEDNNNDDMMMMMIMIFTILYLYYSCLSRFHQFLPVAYSSGVLDGKPVKITSKIFHWPSYRDLIKISDVSETI